MIRPDQAKELAGALDDVVRGFRRALRGLERARAIGGLIDERDLDAAIAGTKEAERHFSEALRLVQEARRR